MTDIATLGLAVDSRQVVTANTALDQLATKSAAAAVNTDKLAASGAKSSAAVKALHEAVAPAAGATDSLADASDRASHAHAGMSIQAQAAFHSIRSMGESIALGIPLSQALTQQMNHLSFAASGEGGISGAFGEVGSKLLEFITPARAAGVAALALAAGAFYVAKSWSDSQEKIQLSLKGIGKASGATVDDINGIAVASASASKVSVTAASEIASTLAQTGKISKDLFGSAIAVTRDYAKIMGVDTTKAAASLAKALVDPVAGADQLNERLGFLDFNTQSLIKSLVTQNNATAAQKIILDGVKSSTDGAADSASGLSKVWESFKTRLSGGVSVVGQLIGGNESDQTKFANSLDKIKKTQDEIGKLQSNKTLQNSPLFSSAMDGLVDRLHKAQEESEKLGNKLRDAAEEMRKIQTNAQSLTLGPVISSLVPEVGIKRNLADVNTAVQGVGGDPGLLKSLGLTAEQVALAKSRAKEIGDSYLSTVESATATSDLQLKAISAKSPSQRADIAYQQTMLSLAGQNLSLSEKQGLASKAAAVAGAAASYQLTQAAQDRLRSAQDSVGATNVEIISLGKTTGEVALLKANWQVYTALRAEAARNHTGFDQAQYDRLVAENTKYAERVQLLEKAKIAGEIKFGASTALLAPEDVQIAQQLKGVYPDVATALGSVEASALRTNTAIAGVSSSVSGTLTPGLADVLDGTKSVSNGFRDMSKAIVRALEEAFIKAMIVAPLLRSLQGAFGGFLPGVNAISPGGTVPGAVGATSVGGAPLGFASGGYTGPGGKNEPAGIVHRGEYVMDAATTSRIGVGNLNKLRGYAGGGYVTPAAESGGGGVSFGDTHIHIQGNADDKTVQSMQRVLAAHEQKLAGIAKQSASQARFAGTGVR
jgi:phage-related minor tail protein